MKQKLVVRLLSDNVLVRALQVGFDASGWLSCHFETRLEDGLREVVNRHRSQDQSEVLVYFVVFDQLGDKNFQLLHPTLVQMAILEEDPVAFHLAFADES